MQRMPRSIAALACALLLVCAAPAHAAVFTVNAPGDHAADGCDPSPGDCTVRDAIAVANAGSDADTISIPAGDYALSAGALSITQPVEISGPPSAQPTATLDPAYSNRVFDVAASANAVTISHLVIANGFSQDLDGGSALIQRGGTVTLDHDILTGNSNNLSGGALLLQGGVMNVTDSEIRGSHAYRGGGLFMSAGTANVERTLWLANDGSTGGGGAIYNALGFLTVDDSTFAGNGASAALGGAIYASASTSLRNDTFEANSASGHRSGDQYYGGSALYAENTSVQMANVLFADSEYGDSCAGTIPFELGGSVDAGQTCGATNGDRSVRLGPLALNGGSARSFLPWADSDGLDAGTNQYCTGFDQRMTPRQSPCDAGAVEGAAGLAAPPPDVANEAAPGPGAGSAEIDATIDRQGLKTSYHVDFGLTEAYGSHTDDAAVPFSPGFGAEDVQALAGALQPGTTYHYRVVAASAAGTRQGGDHTFTTAPAPLVTTGEPTDVQSGQATVTGTVDPRGSATGYRFEYGPTATYGYFTPYADAGADPGERPYFEILEPLTASTTYHYRMVATDERTGVVVATGADRTFTTAAAPAAPVITEPAEGAVLGSTAVRISGTADPGTTVAIDAGDEPFLFPVTDDTGHWSIATDGDFADGGAYRLRAYAYDQAGNASPASALRTFSIDTTAPPPATIDASTTAAGSAAFTFSASGSGITFECRLTRPGEDGAFSPCTSPKEYPGLAPGDYVFQVRSVGASGPSSAVAFRQVTVAAPQPQPQPSVTPAPTPAPTATPVATPTPVPGKTVVATPLSGKVLIKLPGAKGFTAVDAATGIPLGSTVDTRHGVVEITAKPGQTAKFYDGLFKVTQSGGITTLTLVETLAPCGKAAHAAAAKKPKTRKLWGDGTGSFRTRGQYSAATVRGTTWLVQDSCAGTLTRVKKGVVSVTDTVKHKTILLKAGKHYLAKPR